MSLLAAVPNVISVRCHYCSRFWPQSEVLHIGESVIMCIHCHEKHRVAIDAFEPPTHCQGPCGRTFEEISLFTPGDKVGMTVHMKDGVYQILCAQCDADYVQKRRDLYGDTRFGWERKLR